MKGVPLRINLGRRDIENDQVEFVRRDSREKLSRKRSEVVHSAENLLAEIQISLLRKAKDLMDANIHSPSSYDEFKAKLESGGFFKAGWCGMQECEVQIKEETGADIRVLPFEQDELPASCIRCCQPSKKLAVFARAY